jgi:hypothetical protein
MRYESEGHDLPLLRSHEDSICAIGGAPLRVTLVSMSALFDPPPPGSTREKLDAYAAYLAQRDGTPDFEQRTLARREVEMAPLESADACYVGPFDRSLFERQYERYDASRETPPEMQLLLCFMKINANEAFAVERVLERTILREDVVSRLLRLVLLEEGYHTRLLVSAGRLFGVTVDHSSAPVAITRTLVAGISRLPEAMSRPITLAAEAVGIVTFLRTIGAVRRVFRDRPLIRDAMEERVTEVLIDEVGHLSFNRLAARVGTFLGARALVPALALGTHGAMREGEQLGILPVPIHEVLGLDPNALPDEVRRRAFIA